MTTTPERKTPEQIFADAAGMVPGLAVGRGIAALRAAGLLGGDPTEDATGGDCRGYCEEDGTLPCEEPIGGFMCTRSVGHEGVHVACSADEHDLTGALTAAAGVAPREAKKVNDLDVHDWAKIARAKDEAIEATAAAIEGTREFLRAALAESDADERDPEGGAGWDVEVDARTVLGLLGGDGSAPQETAEQRCPECMSLGGSHGLVHVRHPQGGGGWNRPCSRTPEEPAPSPDRENLVAELREEARIVRQMTERDPDGPGYICRWDPDEELLDRAADALAAAPVVDEAKLAEAIEDERRGWSRRGSGGSTDLARAISEALRGGER